MIEVALVAVALYLGAVVAAVYTGTGSNLAIGLAVGAVLATLLLAIMEGGRK